MKLKSKIIKKIFGVTPFIVVFSCGFYIFWPTISSLGVYGDSLMAYWNARVTFEVQRQLSSWTTYFNPYGFSHIFVYLIDKLFGYENDMALYFFTFIFRFLAASSLFFFLRKRNLSRGISTLGALIFMVSPVGLETSEWAFQSVSYLSILFLFLGLTTAYELHSLKKLFIFLLFFFLSIVINPIRAHGIIGTYYLILFMEILISKNNKKLLILAVISSFLLVYFLAKKYTFGNISSNLTLLTGGWQLISESIHSYNPKVFMNFLTTVGNSLLPEYFVNQYQNIRISSLIFGRLRPKFDTLLLSAVVAAILIIWKRYLFIKKSFKITLFLVGFCLIFLTWLAGKYTSIFDYPYATSTFTAIVFVFGIFTFTILDLYKKNFDQLRIDLVILSLTVFYVVVPWVHSPESILSSYHRYLIYPSLVIPILTAFLLLSLKKIAKSNFKRSIITITTVSLILVPYVFLTTQHVKGMLERHSKAYMEKVWSNLDVYLKAIDLSKRKTLFYFVADNPQRVYDSVGYVFGHHVGLRYGIWSLDDLPITLSDTKDLESMLKDGEASKRYIGKKYIYDKDDVFVFKIAGADVVRLNLAQICENCF